MEQVSFPDWRSQLEELVDSIFVESDALVFAALHRIADKANGHPVSGDSSEAER